MTSDFHEILRKPPGPLKGSRDSMTGGDGPESNQAQDAMANSTDSFMQYALIGGNGGQKPI